MPRAKHQEYFEAVERVVAMLRERLPAADAGCAERFTRQYYLSTRPEDLAEIPIEDLYGTAISHWRFARQRKPGVALTRVYNPAYEEHGWQSTHTVIEIVTDDMPFLVDSVRMELVRQGFTVHRIIHPMLGVIRDTKGRRLDILPPGETADGLLAEAVILFEVDRRTEAEVLAGLQADLVRVLGDVRAVVEDWTLMRSKVKEIIGLLEVQELPVPKDEQDEDIAFLRWVETHHFTFVGFRAYALVQQEGGDELRAMPGSGLGIFRDSDNQHVSQSFSHIPPHLRAQAWTPSLLMLTKSVARSTVHRPAYLDYLAIKRFDEAGQVSGEWRFLGLYSSLAYSARPSEIPLLRRKAAHILERAGFAPNSYAGKVLQHILDTFPRDEMFQATEDELYAIMVGVLHVQERHKLRLFLRKDLYGRFVTALVYVPRDHYTTALRLRMQEILMRAFAGQSSEFNVQFSESILARVHFVIRTQPERAAEYDAAELEARLAETMLSWEDELHSELHAQRGEEPANQLIQRYRSAFPAAYREDFTARTAVVDILRLEDISDAHALSTQLYRPLEGPQDLVRFKVFGQNLPMALSDVLPMLEHMGLRVLSARPYVVEPLSGGPFWILDFDMTVAAGIEVEVLEVKNIFQEAFAQVCGGGMEDDSFNRLVLAAGLQWRDVVMLRALCKYLLQTGVPFSQDYMARSLSNNGGIAKLLVQLFHVRFDPDRQINAEELSKHFLERLESALDAVPSLDEDRILRRFLALILGIIRSNYFQRAEGGLPKPYLSFKLDPSHIPDVPLPLPMFEIFVYSPRVEGVHLRGGLVARGGIRWSDRQEDFRTEILGLMKAQMVKNAVIVPVGAKGGFVSKRLAGIRRKDEIHAEVVRCYRSFIAGLLDLTDNRVEGALQPPPNVVRYDGDDPYLVVAADKGTASLSDVANELAKAYGFWLGDAFASGGSTGYDHKKIGITARGAWESVKRHFRELGRDIHSQAFTVIGIGDMGGDVFGNGMLCSRQLRLLAAFNHAHIFIDPNPDAEASYRERERLFKQPRSGWSDYDQGVLSKGGGVFLRSVKSIQLSDEARSVLSVHQKRLTPNELIRAILRAPVDLLWNGGIGTFVKASNEGHAAAGDRANDALRIDASELRGRVVGEGGNLGFTQRARVEFARRGGLINTDAIDNSGGVDCSDHEVNIKISLDQVVRAGDMTEKQRNRLLAEMTEEVAALVLRNNYLQTLALSVSVRHAAELVGDHARLIRSLEREKRLNRRLESLPSDEELAERERSGQGLMRPEIAVLFAYSRIKLFEQLQDSNIGEDPYLSKELQRYFPRPLHDRFSEQMKSHPLRREIIATHISNNMVMRMGSTFAMRMQDEIGQEAADVARAYSAAREIFRARWMWSEIESLDNRVQAKIQLGMMSEVRRLLDRSTLWLLRNRRAPLDIAGAVGQFAAGATTIAERLASLLRDDARDALDMRTRGYRAAGVPDELAKRVAGLDVEFSALDIAEVARATQTPILRVAEAYFALGVALDLQWLRDRIRELPRFNHWLREARSALLEELYAQLRSLTAALVQLTDASHSTEKRVEAWLERNRAGVQHCQRLFADLKSSSEYDLAMLAVAVREIRSLAQA